MAERILLIGAAGKTGEAYAKLIQAHGHQLLWYDKNAAARPIGLKAETLTCVGVPDLDFTKLRDDFDILTLTPGVPLSHPFIVAARTAGKKVISEIAYCAPYLAESRIVGITGTDGKSTTTTITAQILRAGGIDAIECGNFGIPLSEIVLNAEIYRGKILVCELSSYQLEEPGDLRLDVAMYLNLAPDHLDRYSSLEEYGRTKWNIAGLLKPGCSLILQRKLATASAHFWPDGHLQPEVKGPVLEIDTDTLTAPHFAIDARKQLLLEGRSVADLSHTPLVGQHNLANLLFALEAVFQIKESVAVLDFDRILRGLRPLPHRFEVIAQQVFPQITFINDSKATTTQAAMTALNYAARPVYVLMGGKGKGETYRALGGLLKDIGARAYLYGECQNDMVTDFEAEGFTRFTQHENLFKAFHTAKRMVIQDKVTTATILLSPAVTSWDQFSSFEERGNYFRELVLGLK
jgi:UDP-N-acetylmuramoylalanine--D-glutamate ligase